MPTPWMKSVKDSGTILYFNDGGSWAGDIDRAATTFNALGFPVKYSKAKEKSNAHVVIKLSMGPEKVTFSGGTINTPAGFSADVLAGRTEVAGQIVNNGPAELIFAATFLPGKVKATADQKEVIVVHEMIHACGLDGGKPDGSHTRDQDHDTEGILYPVMSPKGTGLIENNAASDAKEMPPIRVGGQTRCKILMIWDPKGCPKP